MDRETFLRALENATRALSGNAELRVLFGEATTDEHTITLPNLPEALPPTQAALLRARADRLAFMKRYEGGALGGWPASLGPLAASVVRAMEIARTQGTGMGEFPGTVGDILTLSHKETLAAEKNGDMQACLVHALSLAVGQAFGATADPLQKAFLETHQKFFTPALKKWLAGAPQQLKNTKDRREAYEELLNILDLKEPEGQNQLPQPSPESGGESTPESGEGEATPAFWPGTGEESDRGNEEEDPQTAPATGDTGAHPFERAPARRGEGAEAYKAFTHQYDKTLQAARLLPEGERTVLAERYQALTVNNRALVRRLSGRLRKMLRAERAVDWVCEQEEGVLNPARLATFIANRDPHIYRQPRYRPAMDTAVTILVDNSGSMRGRPIEMAAISTDVLARTLEQCGVTTEVLGFTTMAWKGGRARMDWVLAGRPSLPGRLNDLLHVIYKPAERAYRACRRNFPLMLADDLLKENVDGESLLWAYKRLLRRPEKRKILVVISDGAPVDYATDRHNPPGYLDRHLRQVISRIEQARRVELLAVGIGHDVGRYYNNATTIEDPDELGEVLVERFLQLFHRR